MSRAAGILEKAEGPAFPRGFLHEGDDPAARVYIRPLDGNGRATCRPQRCEVLIRRIEGTVAIAAPTEEVLAWAAAEGFGLARHVEATLDAIAAERPTFAGLGVDKPLVMGIINVTPDSFSDGGEFLDAERAIAHGRRLVAEGADILDVGGESTRPGAAAVSPETETARVLPVVRALAAEGFAVSIDTRRAAVMKAALEAGARIVNDITALEGDPRAPGVVADAAAPVVLMHMQGEPGTMQNDPRYVDAALDVFDYLRDRIAACEAAGIPRRRIAVDPGIGFGKTVAHNLRILGCLELFLGLGCVILLGVSRKSFIGRLSHGEPPAERLAGSLAAALAGAARGAHILRVHDVAETRQALAVWQAIADAEAGRPDGPP
ncbi:MAG: dihydropteroate synthase [Rhodospirillales bacterium]|nr:dihydropteroate synthase [Rhodospirillales bacterium]